MHGAHCRFQEHLDVMYQARAVPAPDAMQPGGSRYTWVTIGVDGSCRWNRGYVHYGIQACTGRANPSVNNMIRRHVGLEDTTLLFAAHKPTTKKAGKDKYPFKSPHLDTLSNVVDPSATPGCSWGQANR